LNICMIGHGMMGVWHSEALAGTGANLHTLVGRRPEPSAEFARRYGYEHWTVDLGEALAEPRIDAVIVANPTERHAETALACIAAGKQTLLEIPIAMSLAESEQVVDAAERAGVTLAMVHPMRFRPEHDQLRRRLVAGEERLRHVAGRFFIHRLENVGATGYRRSWTDNILWHHTTHLLDLGLWMLEPQGAPVRRVQSFMPDCDPRTGIPMELVIVVETEADQSLVCTGSYYGRERLYDSLLVTDRDSYRLDILARTLTTADGTRQIDIEQANCAYATRDFVEALAAGREPKVPGRAVLPTMRILQRVQDEWDARHGARALPGRPLP
jgi:2-hydroxy-4-carboxymuconate semialdehyde hemiacetal dehydrogenase